MRLILIFHRVVYYELITVSVPLKSTEMGEETEKDDLSGCWEQEWDEC